MKAEINLTNKEKFFALYWGQRIMMIDGDDWVYVVRGQKPILVEYIQLKSLSSITDEDAIEVAKLNTSVNWFNGNTPSVWKNSFGVTVVSNGTGLIQKYGQIILDSEYLSNHQFDLLRSKGYALSWMGLSVDELVKAGWVKLKI
jgi:hypothetical protein